MGAKDRGTRKDWGGKIRVQSLHKPLVIAYIRAYHISSSVMILIRASPECYLLPWCVHERKIILMGSGILVFLTPHASQDHRKKQLLAPRPGAGTAWTGMHCPVETQFSSSWTWRSAGAPDFKPFHKLSLSVIFTAVLTEEMLQCPWLWWKARDQGTCSQPVGWLLQTPARSLSAGSISPGGCVKSKAVGMCVGMRQTGEESPF